jgi:hypothetical protein
MASLGETLKGEQKPNNLGEAKRMREEAERAAWHAGNRQGTETYDQTVARLQQEAKTKQAYEDMTPMDREVAKISAEQWNRYTERFRPFENRVMWDVGNNERFAPAVQGAINANIQQKGGSWGERVASGGAGSGALLDTGGAIKLSRSLAKGGVTGQQELEREKGLMTQNLVTMGRGGGDIAASGLGTAARTATQTAISDWQYDQGLSDLDTRQGMTNSAISTAQRIQTMGTLSDVFSSGAGLAMYGGEKGWFKGDGGTAGWMDSMSSQGMGVG